MMQTYEINIEICKYDFSRFCQEEGLCCVFKIAMHWNEMEGIKLDAFI